MAYLTKAFSSNSQKSGSTIDLLRNAIAYGASSSGKNVNWKTALQVSAVFACLRVRANGVAQVPLKLFQKDGDNRHDAVDHPLYEVLSLSPNDWQTSFEYLQMVVMHFSLCGNHFSFINRGSGGNILELIPFDPGSVTIKRASNWTLTYEVRSDEGKTKVFPAESIWHVRGPSWDGWNGLDAVRLARESIGLSMAIESQQSSMQKNGVQTSGIYSVEGTLGDGQYKDLKEWIDENHAGADNAGSSMVLDRNAKWISTALSGIDAQTLETRRFQIEEVARHLGVNPIMIYAESKNTTYASAEQMFLAHVVHTVSPDYKLLEQSISKNLLTHEERKKGIYPKFIDEGLLRGSMQDKKDTLLGYVNGGLMTANEGRGKLDLNPDNDPLSNQLRVPANIVGTEATDDMTEGQESKAYSRGNNTVVPNVDVKAGDVYLNMPEGMVQVTNEAIKTSPPEINIHNSIPEQKAPIVNVDLPETTVNVASPNVTLEATMPEPTIIVSLPTRKTETDIIRDRQGNMIKATQIESDA